jgi:hypothetical protein
MLSERAAMCSAVSRELVVASLTKLGYSKSTCKPNILLERAAMCNAVRPALSCILILGPFSKIHWYTVTSSLLEMISQASDRTDIPVSVIAVSIGKLGKFNINFKLSH